MITHSTRHILDQENININEQDRVFLIDRINQVKEMFEEELLNPDLIKNKRRAGGPSTELLYKPPTKDS